MPVFLAFSGEGEKSEKSKKKRPVGGMNERRERGQLTSAFYTCVHRAGIVHHLCFEWRMGWTTVAQQLLILVACRHEEQLSIIKWS